MTQDGVQIRLTMGQTVASSSWPSIQQTHAGEQQDSGFADSPGCSSSNSSPASTPKIMVAIEGMKFRVAYPPGLNMERVVAGAGKQVEEPAIELGGDIGVLVPVCEEPSHDELRLVRAVDSAMESRGRATG